MSTNPEASIDREFGKLAEIPSPHPEPRDLAQTLEPRKVNNLTLIDGKSFLSTTVAGDISPAGAPDVGLFHDDTRFLSQLELRIFGHRAVDAQLEDAHLRASRRGAVFQHRENLCFANRTDHRHDSAARFVRF